MVKTRLIRHSSWCLFVTSETYVTDLARISRFGLIGMHLFLRKHTYIHGSDILLDLKVMLCTRLIIGSIFNVPLQTKTAFLGPLTKYNHPLSY